MKYNLQLLVDILNLVANIAGFRTLWLTAAPPATITAAPEVDEKASGYDVGIDADIQQPMGLDAGLDEI